MLEEALHAPPLESRRRQIVDRKCRVIRAAGYEADGYRGDDGETLCPCMEPCECQSEAGRQVYLRQIAVLSPPHAAGE